MFKFVSINFDAFGKLHFMDAEIICNKLILSGKPYQGV